MASLMVFLGINGHHFLLESMVASFRAVPLDTFALTGSSIEIIIRLITTVTIVAVKIAAPVMIALLVTNIALALLSRVAPQLNIFALSMQFKVAVGLIVLFITVPLFVMTMKQVMVIFQNETFQVLMALNPKRAS
jgi:flagellar biosynthesis protein FliR